MINIKFDNYISEEKINKHIENAYNNLNLLKSGKIDFTDWVNLPTNYDKKEMDDIKRVAKEVRENADTMVVIGIGGSYLGAKAAIEFLSKYYEDNKVKIIFAGNNLSERYIEETLKYVKERNFYINVISKSGGTLESEVSFEAFKKLCEDKYGLEESKKRIIVTTDKNTGKLKELSNANGYRTFIVPSKIGGRYSVMSPVGLFPIQVSGFDTEKILCGAKQAFEKYTSCSIENEAITYSIIRNVLYDEGKDIEVFSNFAPNMVYFGEWLKQLFGESECKGKQGIFPAALSLSTDLHSLGQTMQDGKRNVFETLIKIDSDYNDERISFNGVLVNDINEIVYKATSKAHKVGDVPIIEIHIDRYSEESLGELFYFFMISCALSSMQFKVNPFNQPGVEEYKKNIKDLLKEVLDGR